MAYNTAYLGGPIYFGSKGAASFWVYDDTALVATVIAAGYISDARERGMEQGDFVLYRKFDSLSAKTNPSISLHTVTLVTASGATLSSAIGDSSGLTVAVNSTTGTPGVGDDINDGYSLGSLWVETDADEVYANVDTTSGAAVWYPLTDHFCLTFTGISLDNDDDVTSSLPVPFASQLTAAYTVVSSAAGTALNATASLVLSRNATAITNGVITIANAATGGDVDVATPTALNVFAAGDVLNIAVSTTQNITKACNFVAYFKRNAA